MRFLIYGALLLALAGIGLGIWRAKRKGKFALVYSAVGFLLVMLLVWWAAPAYRFLQFTPDERVEKLFLFQSGVGGRIPPLEGEEKTKILDALRETTFAHEYKHNYHHAEERVDYYHMNIYVNNDWTGVDVFISASGEADVYLGMGDSGLPPWGYQATNPEVLAEAVLEVMEP